MFKVETQITGLKIKWKRSQSMEQKYKDMETIREWEEIWKIGPEDPAYE